MEAYFAYHKKPHAKYMTVSQYNAKFNTDFPEDEEYDTAFKKAYTQARKAAGPDEFIKHIGMDHVELVRFYPGDQATINETLFKQIMKDRFDDVNSLWNDLNKDNQVTINIIGAGEDENKNSRERIKVFTIDGLDGTYNILKNKAMKKIVSDNKPQKIFYYVERDEELNPVELTQWTTGKNRKVSMTTQRIQPGDEVTYLDEESFDTTVRDIIDNKIYVEGRRAALKDEDDRRAEEYLIYIGDDKLSDVEGYVNLEETSNQPMKSGGKRTVFSTGLVTGGSDSDEDLEDYPAADTVMEDETNRALIKQNNAVMEQNTALKDVNRVLNDTNAALEGTNEVLTQELKRKENELAYAGQEIDQTKEQIEGLKNLLVQLEEELQTADGGNQVLKERIKETNDQLQASRMKLVEAEEKCKKKLENVKREDEEQCKRRLKEQKLADEQEINELKKQVSKAIPPDIEDTLNKLQEADMVKSALRMVFAENNDPALRVYIKNNIERLYEGYINTQITVK